jgi:hypothetical protein
MLLLLLQPNFLLITALPDKDRINFAYQSLCSSILILVTLAVALSTGLLYNEANVHFLNNVRFQIGDVTFDIRGLTLMELMFISTFLTRFLVTNIVSPTNLVALKTPVSIISTKVDDIDITMLTTKENSESEAPRGGKIVLPLTKRLWRPSSNNSRRVNPA